ncbi:DUF308 domain-containing protein [Sphingopyxis fribergensis]
MTGNSARVSRAQPSFTLLWSWGVGIGAAGALVALLLASRYFFATVALTYFLALVMIVTALLHIREASGNRRRAERGYWLGSGIPYLSAALLLLANPMLGNPRIAIILAGCVGLSGAARLALALGAHPLCRGWLYLSGIVSLAIALGLGFGWPFASVGLAARALAVDLAVQGVVLVLLEARRAHPSHGLARLGTGRRGNWQ